MDRNLHPCKEKFIHVYFIHFNSLLQMLKAEDEIEKLKGENSNINKINHSQTDELSSLQEQVHQLELDLTISQEKHRTCQKEVRHKGHNLELSVLNCLRLLPLSYCLKIEKLS